MFEYKDCSSFHRDSYDDGKAAMGLSNLYNGNLHMDENTSSLQIEFLKYKGISTKWFVWGYI